jgi:Flp pilus assembly protein TadG
MMEQPHDQRVSGGGRARWSRRRGSEMLEFTMVFLPLMGMLTVTADVAWSVFVKSTLQRAVRMGVRTGVTLTSGQMTNGACLTATVKGIVQDNSLGLLRGTSGLAKIKVNYFQPPLATSTAAAADVSTQANGNSPGNIMQVSVQSYSLIPLMPRVYQWNQPIDSNPLVFTVASADKIEPSRNPPCIGTAP